MIKEVLLIGLRILNERLYGLDRRMFWEQVWVYIPPAPPSHPKLLDRGSYPAFVVMWDFEATLPYHTLSYMDEFSPRDPPNFIPTVCCFCQHHPTFEGNDQWCYAANSTDTYEICYECWLNAPTMGYIKL